MLVIRTDPCHFKKVDSDPTQGKVGSGSAICWPFYGSVYKKNVGSESAKYSDKDEISPFYLYPVVEMWRFQVSKNSSSPLLPLKTLVLRMRREKATMVVDLVLPL